MPRHHRLLMRRALLLVLGLALGAVAAAAEPPPAPVMAALARGVNLPIWFAYRGQTGIDTQLWYPDAADFRRIRALGFRHVRVQFDPAWFRDDAGALRRERIAELQRELAPAWAQGLLVVLAADPEGPEKSRLVKDAAGIAEFAGFWRAFAGAMSRARPDRLVFEVMNEPTDTDAPRNRALMQQSAEAIRAAAPRHVVVVEGHGYSGVGELLAIEPLPLDHLVYSFHFYEPHTFTHQGAFWGWPMFLKFQNLPYPSSPEALAPFVEKAEAEVKPHLLKYGEEHWDAARVKARLREARQWADAKGVAIWCGEFGVTRLGPPLAPRRVWLADVKRALDELGIPWALFGYAGHFGLVTGKAGQRELNPADAAALDLPAER